MCHKEYVGEKGVSGTCSQYGKSYGKLKFCAECGLANYCKDSTAIEKVHVDYTTRENFSEVENIAQYAKASNVSGQVIANLLQLTDFNLVKFYVVICRLGNLTYKEIANFLGISDVQVFKYCESLSPEIKKLFKHKSCTMLPIGNEYNDLTRGSREVIVSVEVGIIQRLKENNLPAMLEKVEDMVQTIQNLKLVNNRGYVRKITNTPAYDVQSMVSNKLFITVMQLEVRVM